MEKTKHVVTVELEIYGTTEDDVRVFTEEALRSRGFVGVVIKKVRPFDQEFECEYFECESRGEHVCGKDRD